MHASPFVPSPSRLTSIPVKNALFLCSPIYPPGLGNHKNPLLVLAFRLILLFLLGTSIPFSSAPVPPPLVELTLEWPIPPPLARLHTLSLLPKAPLPLLRDIPIPLSPSISLSSLSALAASSFAALSARLAARPASDSETCSSSIVLSNLSILSRPLAISSWSCAFAFSLRSICSWRSLTVRSTLRTERCDLLRSVSCASSCDSSYLFFVSLFFC
jgi:hypothetical protein